jgi:hypothetical protein
MKKILTKIMGLMYLFLIQIPVIAQNNLEGNKNEVPIKAVSASWKQITKYDSLNPNLEIKKILAEDKGVKNPRAIVKRLKSTPKKTESKSLGTITELNPISTSPKAKVMAEAFPCRNFTALDAVGSTIPPDVNGAVGFNHLMTTLNTQVRIQDKNGGIISTVNLLAFWQAALPAITDVFDPKITYDPYNQRFIFVTVAQRRSAASSLLIAVSQTSDPTGGWWFYQIDADGDDNEWFDFPSLGFNKKWIVVGGNMYGNPLNTGGYTTTRTFVFRKFDLYAGSATTYNSWDRNDYFTIAPAITYDNNIEEVWCVTNDDTNDNDLRLFKVSGGYTTPSFTEEGWVTVGTDWAAAGVNAPQSGGTGIDLGDQRMLNVFYRAGSVWSAQNIFLPVSGPTYGATQVVRINPYAETHQETIRFANSSGTSMYGYPSVAVNTDGDFFVGYAAFFTTTFASGYFSYRRNGSSTFEHFNIANGLANYVGLDGSGNNRWGDYTATAIDPEDDRAVWTIQEFARTGNTWGTNWAKVCPVNCPSSINLSATAVSGTLKKHEATNFINSTAVNNSGTQIKYDAGTKITLSPGFRASTGSKFRAYIDGCGND